ncbi:hypothetical protein J2S11_001419 [Bacillus horti]|uniref:EcsC family protein n=2 Tax=Caldalkalibacillus horti TaxID=77523 RepID=A0ABT9VWZ3_9BACI|nr:hypothetical protein [Bacillus horti]
MRIRKFEKEVYKTSDFMGWTKGVQQKFDGLIPRKVHQSLASALEKGIKSFIEGINLLPKQQMVQVEVENPDDLEGLSKAADKIILYYKRIASAEGAGTGFGGLVSAAIDFPALISIKLKMLQELWVLFGYRLENFEDRLFLLKVFELQFSGEESKQRVWKEVKTWEQNGENEDKTWDDYDWETFYMEYKQSIELRKLFQLIPGFGAIVGAWANYSFLEDLGSTAVTCLQLRYLQSRYDEPITRR